MPRNRGKRTRVGEGIYLDDKGYEVVARIGSGKTAVQKSKRFEKGSRMKDMTGWRTTTLAALAKVRRIVLGKAAKGTLSHDIKTYLPSVVSMPSYVSRRSDIQAWEAPFGARPRRSLTLAELQAQMAQWQEEGYAASTLSHRKDALVDLYRVLDEGDADNVALQLKTPAEPDPAPRSIAADAVQAILDSLQPSLSRGYLRVLATTGIPPARLRGLKKASIDLGAATVFLTKRRKGKGTTDRTFRVTDAGVEAFRDLLAQDERARLEYLRRATLTRARRCGAARARTTWTPEQIANTHVILPVTKEALYMTFQRGWMRANVARTAKGLPPIPPCRPYDLRHAFLSAVYLLKQDIRATSEIGDITVEMALRYTSTTVPEIIDRTVEALNRAGAQQGGE